MPYLQYVFCEECENVNLDIDHLATVKAYEKDGRRAKEAFVNPATLIWDYLIYRCPYCGKRYKYTFRDIEIKVRNYLGSLGDKYLKRAQEIDSLAGKETALAPPPASKKRVERLYRAK